MLERVAELLRKVAGEYSGDYDEPKHVPTGRHLKGHIEEIGKRFFGEAFVYGKAHGSGHGPDGSYILVGLRLKDSVLIPLKDMEAIAAESKRKGGDFIVEQIRPDGIKFDSSGEDHDSFEEETRRAIKHFFRHPIKVTWKGDSLVIAPSKNEWWALYSQGGHDTITPFFRTLSGMLGVEGIYAHEVDLKMPSEDWDYSHDEDMHKSIKEKSWEHDVLKGQGKRDSIPGWRDLVFDRTRVTSPEKLIAGLYEDGNHPGYFKYFATQEEADATNEEHGTYFFKTDVSKESIRVHNGTAYVFSDDSWNSIS